MKIEESAEIFEFIRNMPLVPLDIWFNAPYASWTASNRDLPLYMYERPQLFYPLAVMEKAIRGVRMLPGNKGFRSWSNYNSLAFACQHKQHALFDENNNPVFNTEVDFFAVNLRIERYEDGNHWLFADLKFVRKDAPAEFRRLTLCKKAQMLEWMIQSTSWPTDRKVGLTNAGVEFWPVGCGNVSLHELGQRSLVNGDSYYQSGVRFDEYHLMSVMDVNNPPFGDPMPLSYIWHYFDKNPVTPGSFDNEWAEANAYGHELMKRKIARQKSHYS